MSTEPAIAIPEVSLSKWERGFEKVVEWVPYVTLGYRSRPQPVLSR